MRVEEWVRPFIVLILFLSLTFRSVVPRKKRRLSSPPVDVKPIPVEDALAEDAVAESSQAAAKRMRELQDDPRITKVEAHQVLCGVCKQWIKLQPYREHDTWNWRKHIPNCVERHRYVLSVCLIPSLLIATILFADSLVKEKVPLFRTDLIPLPSYHRVNKLPLLSSQI